MVFYLLGMPGTGKSSIGKNVAKMLDFNFIDLDKMIEKKSDSSIAEIWQNFGEDYFRNLESKTLKEISALQNTLVSCGGGTPCYFENIKYTFPF
jgi:shikimate kinase